MASVFDYIFKQRDSETKLSLERVKILLDLLDNPQDNLKFIHIAGTNGKGSITTTLSNILIDSNYKVGKYISPYVDNFFERIQINNEYIKEEEANKVLQKLIPCIEEMTDKPTSFEILAALAFEYFYENNCDIVCLEVGMGGRFDATNCITNTLISIISVIDYDHMEYLGNTIEEIAFEKCGIIKDGKTTISYPLQKYSAKIMIEAMAKIRKNKFIDIDLNNLTNVEKIEFNYKFNYKNNEYILGLNGKHQVYNALVVIECIEELNKKGFIVTYDNLFNSIKNTRFIGRLDLINEKPFIFLDGAHNISGANALKEFILDNNKNKNIILITSMIKGKVYEEYFSSISNLASNIIITKITDNIKIGEDLDKLYQTIRKYNDKVQIIRNQEEALKNAISIANPNDIIIITGSLYLVSEYYSMFKSKNLFEN